MLISIIATTAKRSMHQSPFVIMLLISTDLSELPHGYTHNYDDGLGSAPRLCSPSRSWQIHCQRKIRLYSDLSSRAQSLASMKGCRTVIPKTCTRLPSAPVRTNKFPLDQLICLQLDERVVRLGSIAYNTIIGLAKRKFAVG